MLQLERVHQNSEPSVDIFYFSVTVSLTWLSQVLSEV